MPRRFDVLLYVYIVRLLKTWVFHNQLSFHDAHVSTCILVHGVRIDIYFRDILFC
jgi:hypothetical protein